MCVCMKCIYTLKCMCVLPFVLMCFFVFTLFFCVHTKRRTPNETILRATNQTIIIIIFFVHYSAVVIECIQGRCECTYIRTANNTLIENQNEQTASKNKKDKRKRKMNVRKKIKRNKQHQTKTSLCFFVESL